MKANAIMPAFEFLDSNFVQDAHQKGLKVIPWTVNRRDDIQSMLELGVDGIISNFPTVFVDSGNQWHMKKF